MAPQPHAAQRVLGRRPSVVPRRRATCTAPQCALPRRRLLSTKSRQQASPRSLEFSSFESSMNKVQQGDHKKIGTRQKSRTLEWCQRQRCRPIVVIRHLLGSSNLVTVQVLKGHTRQTAHCLCDFKNSVT